MKKNMIVKMKDFQFNEDLFKPMRTGTVVDTLLSTDGGLMKGCNFAFVGDPGVGKSTVLLDILSDLQRNGNKVLFVSGEMNPIDMFGYTKRFPKFNNVPILFMGDAVDSDPLEVLEDTFNEGWDVVLVDSMAEVVVSVADYHGGTTKSAETKVLNMFEKHNLAGNKANTNTTFLIIQQVTKTGQFSGSNRFKHMLTGMAHMRFDENQSRVFYFSKNRRGSSNTRLMFDLQRGGRVAWVNPATVTTQGEAPRRRGRPRKS